jgi:NAD(P)-dependent dehydrogenase (short-subunit alcohol dehydrogenase family)
MAGVYYLWDDKLYTELSPDDLISHFKVNVVVSLPPALTLLYRSPSRERRRRNADHGCLCALSQGPFMASKAFLPALSRSSTPTRIINVSSDMASISSKSMNYFYTVELSSSTSLGSADSNTQHGGERCHSAADI